MVKYVFSPIRASGTYCQDCYIKQLINIDELTIDSCTYSCSQQQSNRYVRIRDRAKRLYSLQAISCEICNYSNAVQICHIISISKWPKDTLIKTVNARNNIIFLCPNHHWELDHNILKLVRGQGLEP